MNPGEISEALFKAGVMRGDVLMIHGDSIVAAQIKQIKDRAGLQILFDEILNYLGEQGTLVIPSFTYSFTKPEIFDIEDTSSTVGYFSEYFRLLPGVVRSSNPLFSVCAIGKHKLAFKNSSISDCFGPDSCFGVLNDLNGRLMNLGCDFMVTFVHYVEQMVNVSYRYHKKFSGEIKSDTGLQHVVTNYFVGDMSLRYHADLSVLKQQLLETNKLAVVPFGRFASYTVSCSDFLEGCKNVLSEDKYGLIEEVSNGYR